MSAPLTVLARVPLGARAAEVHAALAEYAGHVRASAGTVAFEVYDDLDDPTSAVVWEVYRDADAFQAHLDDPANAVFNARLAGLTDGASSTVARLAPRGAAPVPTGA
ncbi:MAG: antibiotic biosynthesis monooxygenase [Protaetiibacter sp.]